MVIATVISCQQRCSAAGAGKNSSARWNRWSWGAFQLLNPRDVPRSFENSAANFNAPGSPGFCNEHLAELSGISGNAFLQVKRRN
jgi:hypothetical protein